MASVYFSLKLSYIYININYYINIYLWWYDMRQNRASNYVG